MTTATPATPATPDARSTIEQYADRLAARSGLPDPARGDARAELVSHLYEAAQAKSVAGPPTAAHAQAAIAELGGDAGVEATFFAPRRAQLPTASFGRRAAAYLVDLVLFAVLLLPFAIVAFALSFLWLSGPVGAAVLVAAVAGFVEHRWGRTPGKALFGLRAVGPGGRPPTFKEGFLRNLTKGAPPLLLLDYVVGALLDKGQHLRLCDRLADTRVVREPVAHGNGKPGPVAEESP